LALSLRGWRFSVLTILVGPIRMLPRTSN
jgi:hypothetical protein